MASMCVTWRHKYIWVLLSFHFQLLESIPLSYSSSLGRFVGCIPRSPGFFVTILFSVSMLWNNLPFFQQIAQKPLIALLKIVYFLMSRIFVKMLTHLLLLMYCLFKLNVFLKFSVFSISLHFSLLLNDFQDIFRKVWQLWFQSSVSECKELWLWNLTDMIHHSFTLHSFESWLGYFHVTQGPISRPIKGSILISITGFLRNVSMFV